MKEAADCVERDKLILELIAQQKEQIDLLWATVTALATPSDPRTQRALRAAIDKTQRRR